MSDVTTIKYENVQQVIRVFRGTDQVTKTEIAQAVGLTGVTVNSIVSRLERAGIICRLGFSSSNGGRRAQLFGLNKDYGVICGVSLRTGHITVGIMDFTMKLRSRTRCRWNLAASSVEETISRITSLVLEAVKADGSGKLIGVGVNVPGPVNRRTGTVVSMHGFPKWHHVPIKRRLEEALKVPVTVDKDVSSGMELISLIRRLQENVNMVYISVDGGIGCGIMLHGETYCGNHGIAGEIGHMMMFGDDERCSCGSRGCLELSASDFAVINQCRRALNIDESAVFEIEDAISLYGKGNEEVDRIFEGALRALAVTVRNIYMLYDPDIIYLRCRWLDVNEALFFRNVEELYVENTLIEPGSLHLIPLREENFILRSAGVLAWDSALTGIIV